MDCHLQPPAVVTSTEVRVDTVNDNDDKDLTLKLAGYTTPGQQLFRHVLFDQLYASLPKDPQVKVQIYNAEIAPGGHTNWHCHNGATFFIALQGIFEAEFEDGILVKAKAGDVYSEPIARIHRGHNPHPELPYCASGSVSPPPIGSTSPTSSADPGELQDCRIAGRKGAGLPS